jgi:hypothetical protein
VDDRRPRDVERLSDSAVAWGALLIVYRRIAVREPVPFTHTLSNEEIAVAVDSFLRFPALAARLSDGEAVVEASWIQSLRRLDSLTPMGEGIAWPSPTDVQAELDEYAEEGAYDSVFVLWPQRDLAAGSAVPTGGWGLAIPATDWSNGATYATVANAEARLWAGPERGEIWLHEWLHGVCAFYAGRGFEMPAGDADGAERHGYRHSATAGWCDYYADLMTGRVEVGGRRLGITPAAWRTGNTRSHWRAR